MLRDCTLPQLRRLRDKDCLVNLNFMPLAWGSRGGAVGVTIERLLGVLSACLHIRPCLSQMPPNAPVSLPIRHEHARLFICLLVVDEVHKQM